MSDSVTPQIAAHQALPSLTLSQSLLRFMSIKLMMLSKHILCHPLLLLPSVFPIIRVFSSESALHIRWLKYWGFSFSISSSKEYSGLISFRIDWFDFLAVQGTLKVFSSTTIRKHQFFGTHPSLWSNAHMYITTGKTIALTVETRLEFMNSELANMVPVWFLREYTHMDSIFLPIRTRLSISFSHYMKVIINALFRTTPPLLTEGMLF